MIRIIQVTLKTDMGSPLTFTVDTPSYETRNGLVRIYDHDDKTVAMFETLNIRSIFMRPRSDYDKVTTFPI